MNFLKEEIEELKKEGYNCFGDSAYKSNYPDIIRSDSTMFPFRVGIEGTDYDTDGDLGWCRTWKHCANLAEALELAKNNRNE